MGQHIFNESDVFIGHFTSGKPVGIAEILKGSGHGSIEGPGTAKPSTCPASVLGSLLEISQVVLSTDCCCSDMAGAMPGHGDCLGMQGQERMPYRHRAKQRSEE